MSCDQPVFEPINFFSNRPASVRPYRDELPALAVEELDSEYSFAFNYANPSGVILLRGSARDEALDAVSSGGLENLTSLRQDELSPTLRRLLRTQSQRVDATLNYWIHVTDSCNLGCYYCYIDDVDRFQPSARQAMTSDTAAIVLERVRSDALNQGIRKIHFKFAGGEPLLAVKAVQQFCELADAALPAAGYAVSYGVITNGLSVSDDALEMIQQRAMNVSISLDGHGELHNRTRYVLQDGKRFGSWEQVCSNIETFQQKGVTPYVLHTVSPANIDGLDRLQNFLSAKGIGFRISLVRLGHLPSDSSRQRFQDALERFYANLPDVLPLNLRIERDVRFAEWNPSRSKQMACGSARNYFSIDSHGKLSSCQMAAARPLVDLKVDDIQMARQIALARPDTKILAAPNTRSGGCTQCYFRSTCAGGCPQHTLAAAGTMDHPSPWCGVYGALYPVYVRAIARHRLRVIRAIKIEKKHEQPQRN